MLDALKAVWITFKYDSSTTLTSNRYSNTLLATLNSRSLITDLVVDYKSTPLWEDNLTDLRVATNRDIDSEQSDQTKSEFWENQPSQSIHIMTTTEKHSDDPETGKGWVRVRTADGYEALLTIIDSRSHMSQIQRNDTIFRC